MSRIILFFLIAAPFIPSFCYGDTLTVDDDAPADYTKIQDAINAAYDGDTVEVAEGHYFENIDFRGKAITVTSTDPCDPCTVADTIIDANGDGIVVSFHSDEEPNSIITGFTITGGYAEYGAGITCWNNSTPAILNCIIRDNIAKSDGGGIYCNNISNPIISECSIKRNSASSQGGGIYCYNCSPTISNCAITENTASKGGGVFSYISDPDIRTCVVSQNSAAGYGGGIYCFFGNPNIDSCTIKNNSAHQGGGIYCHRNDPIIIKCIITSNLASQGGGVYCLERSPTIKDCNISGNSANQGGGVYLSHSGNPTIANCTFNNNKASAGGGIYSVDNSSPEIINNIVCNSISGNGIYAMYSNPIISYNNVWGNMDGDYGGWAYPGEGDISVDPCFVDPGYWEDPCNTPGDLTDDVWVDGDYHLRYDSLCINAGDPCFAADPCEVDMDGESRVRLGRVDIGADEAGSNPADFDESGLVDLSDFDALSAAWLTVPEDTGWNRACDISGPEDDVIDLLDFAVYSEQWLWQAQWYIP